jgi:hypothetical protein
VRVSVLPLLLRGAQQLLVHRRLGPQQQQHKPTLRTTVDRRHNLSPWAQPVCVCVMAHHQQQQQQPSLTLLDQSGWLG